MHHVYKNRSIFLQQSQFHSGTIPVSVQTTEVLTGLHNCTIVHLSAYILPPTTTPPHFIMSGPQVEVLFHFCQRNKVHVEGIITSNCTVEALDECCCPVAALRDPVNPTVDSVSIAISSGSTGRIRGAEPDVQRLFVAGEIGVFDQLLQDSSEHHDHVL